MCQISVVVTCCHNVHSSARPLDTSVSGRCIWCPCIFTCRNISQNSLPCWLWMFALNAISSLSYCHKLEQSESDRLTNLASPIPPSTEVELSLMARGSQEGKYVFCCVSEVWMLLMSSTIFYGWWTELNCPELFFHALSPLRKRLLIEGETSRGNQLCGQ